MTNLNGLYNADGDDDGPYTGMNWYSVDKYKSLKSSEMKIRPYDYKRA